MPSKLLALIAAWLTLSGNLFAEELGAPREPEVQIPPERQAYRVRIVIAWGDSAGLLPTTRREVRERLKQAAECGLGEMWTLDVRDAGVFPDAAAWLQRLTVNHFFESDEWGLKPQPPDPAASVPENSPTAPIATPATLDKLYILAVDGLEAAQRLSGRELDVATAQLSLAASRDTYRREALPQELLTLVQTLFRPVVTVQQTPAGTSLHARAGELTPRDPVWQPLAEKRLFEPYYRYLNAARAVERIQAVPWTYLRVTSAQYGRGTCEVLTGLRSPLTSRRTRVETLALGVQRHAPTTRVTLLSPAPRSRPLGGITVVIENGTASKDTKVSSLQRFSDRQGQVVIPAEPQNPQVWLSLFSGKSLLARLPLVPGLHALESVELPDDSLRLAVEGEVSILQADLVDTVAQRAVMMSTIRARARAADWPQVDELSKQLAGLADAQVFTARLSAIQLPALNAAREAKSRNTELRIKKLCDESSDLIAAYLNPDKLRALREEVQELRTIDTQDKADAEQFEKQNRRK